MNKWYYDARVSGDIGALQEKWFGFTFDDFDAAYPDTYTETMRRREARAAARRLKDDESTVTHQTLQSLPPAPAPAG